MLSALALVLPSHAVVGTSESSLALVHLQGGEARDWEGPVKRPSDQPGRIPPESLQFYTQKTPFSKKCSSSAVHDLAFNGATVFAAAGSTVLAWDVVRAQRTSVARPAAPDLAVACAWLTPHCAVSAGAACAVSFWDTRAGARAVHLAKVARDNLYALGAAENGVYAAGADGKVQFVDLRREVHDELDFGDFGSVVGMDTEEAAVVVVFENGAVRKGATGAEEASFCAETVAAKSRVGCAVRGQAGEKGGFLAVGSEDGVVRFWDGPRFLDFCLGQLGETVPCLEFSGEHLVGTAGEAVWRWTIGR